MAVESGDESQATTNLEQWRKLNEHGRRLSKVERERAVDQQRIAAMEEAMTRCFNEVAAVNKDSKENIARVETQLSTLAQQVADILTTAGTVGKIVKGAARLVAIAVTAAAALMTAFQVAISLGWVGT